MAKRNTLEENLSSNSGKIKKKPVFNTSKAEEVVKAVHKESSKEQEVQTTIYFPKSIHKKMRAKVLEDETTMKEYLITLVKKDMNLG